MLDAKYKIIKGDTFELIKTLNNNSVDLLITSPPYNVGKAYEKKVDFHSYLKPYVEFAKVVFDKISPQGSICWEVGNYIKDGEVYPLDVYFYDIFKDAGFKLRNRIIWHFEHGLHASKRFSGRYETILWFTKSDDYTFNLDSVRVPSKYPGKLHYKGEKRGLPSGNPLGKNPSDLWTILTKDWECELWNIPNVKSNHPEKTIHPCQFPIELIQRCILALTNSGDMVFDPFMGVGSALIAAMLHDRRGLGFEISDEYIEIANKRINDYLNNNLKIRPLGKPVYKPTGRESLTSTSVLGQRCCLKANMTILGEYSFAGGKDFITSKYPKLLQEIEEAIKSVDAAKCRTKESQEKTMPGKMLYSPVDLNKEFEKHLFPRGWKHVKEYCDYSPNYYVNGYRPTDKKVYPFRDMDFVKDKLGVEVQFGKYAFMVYNVCAKMTIFRNFGHIETGIEIVPIKELAEQMSTGVSYFEQFVWDLEQRGVSNIDVPALIIGIGA